MDVFQAGNRLQSEGHEMLMGRTSTRTVPGGGALRCALAATKLAVIGLHSRNRLTKNTDQLRCISSATLYLFVAIVLQH